ncbi:MAG: EAL domain-containing protein, partial [Vibrio anguillarum]
LDRCVSILSLQDLPKIKTLFGQGVGVTINRSLNTKMDATQILANTMEIIDRYTDTPQSVTIELTESAYFDSQSHQVDALNALRSRGVTVAIDDFGTGYSSFTYLSDCNFDYLKIDREFVTDIQVNSNKYSIVKMITELSHTLGVKVVAEGVETEHEVWVLKSLGIDYIQGYIFSKPLPLKELVRAKEYRNRFVYSGAKVEQERKPNCLLNLFKEGKPHLDPSEPISLAYQYIKATKVDVLPVVNQGECVGIVDVASLNLYLTPNMGTDLETTREAAVWRKPVNQIMKFHFTQLDAYTELNQVVNLIEKGHAFPWVLVDNTRYKGLLTQADVLRYLAESQ